MSTVPRLAARLAVVASALLGAVLLLPAVPAHADVDFRIEELPRTLSAGGPPGAFEAIVNNDDEDDYRSVRLFFTVRLNGLRAGSVRMSRGGTPLATIAGNGTVRFSDPSAFPMERDSDRQQTYELQFLSNAPDGRATLTLEGYGQQERGGLRLLGRSRGYSITVREGDPSATAAPTVTPGNPIDVVPTVDTTDVPDAAGPPQPRASSSDSGTLWPVYLIGILLLLLGGGAVGWLLVLRTRESRAVEHDAYGGYGSGYGAPATSYGPVSGAGAGAAAAAGHGPGLAPGHIPGHVPGHHPAGPPGGRHAFPGGPPPTGYPPASNETTQLLPRVVEPRPYGDPTHVVEPYGDPTRVETRGHHNAP